MILKFKSVFKFTHMSQSSERNIDICVVGTLSALRIASKARVAPAGIPAEPILAKAAIIPITTLSATLKSILFS